MQLLMFMRVANFLNVVMDIAKIFRCFVSCDLVV